MSDVIIKVENVSKKYELGVIGAGTLYHTLWHFLDKLKRGGRKAPSVEDEFWALKNINFEVKRGEVIGIIGRNGAGKSTLLKVLSRITEPTGGKITLNGRVASLLEVGTGFHPELSGRENIYLNGSILGMTRTEIKSKFKEIVEFSGVEKFLDTPVKRYSSGMYVRLAFAVAAHLEPEILVIDEVLSVGDAEFQKKCIGKMSDVAKSGRTVLFVSHNMGAVRQLCSKAILISEGVVSFEGSVNLAIEKYLETGGHAFEVKEESKEANFFKNIQMINEIGDVVTGFKFDEKFGIKVEIIINDWNNALELSLGLYDKILNRLFTKNIVLKEYYNDSKYLTLEIFFDKEFLMPGSFSWIISINHPRVQFYDVQDDILSFTIFETGTQFNNRSYSGSVFAPKIEIKQKQLENG